jgi:hypothetical protein
MTSSITLIWEWFGLSYASWLTLPRVLLCEMPEDWQNRLVQLLDEFDQEFSNRPDFSTRVHVVDTQGRLIKTPDWIFDYRHPDCEQIDRFRCIESPRGGEENGGVL